MQHNSRYILIFTLIMTVVIALVLAGLYSFTKPKAEFNEAVFKKKAILQSIDSKLGQKAMELSNEEVESIFSNKVTQISVSVNGDVLEGVNAEEINMAREKKKALEDMALPVFSYDNGDEKYYIVAVLGNGLWNLISGYIAISDDFNTVIGAAFDHVGETPGLGAEIKDNPSFSAQFSDKKLYAPNGTYKSITVMKGGAKDLTHEVDGISGATVTCDGVSEMLSRGIKYYEPYFNKIKG